MRAYSTILAMAICAVLFLAFSLIRPRGGAGCSGAGNCGACSGTGACQTGHGAEGDH
jgi:hypothetical protein